MKRCFSLQNMCELYHVCWFIRQYLCDQKRGFYSSEKAIVRAGSAFGAREGGPTACRKRPSGRWGCRKFGFYKRGVILRQYSKYCGVGWLFINQRTQCLRANSIKRPDEIVLFSCCQTFGLINDCLLCYLPVCLTGWIIIFLNWNGTNTYSLTYGKILSA